jgi:hypothetical protein
MNMITCKNCDNNFEGKFCNNCGQSADTQRLDFKFLLTNLRKNFLKYFHGGIFYSAAQLFTRPGHTIREYIEGKRVKHFEPIALLLSVAAFYGIFYHYFGINLFEGDKIPGDKINAKMINDWFSNNFSLETLLLVPLYSIGSYIVFRKQMYNFIEHFYLNTFLGSQRIILRIVTFPLFAVFNGTPQLHIVMNINIFIDVLLLLWSYTQFFNKLTKTKALLLSLLSYAIFFLIMMGVVALILLLFA